jgi:hypothetical protein
MFSSFLKHKSTNESHTILKIFFTPNPLHKMADHCFTASITCNYCSESEETNGQCYRAQFNPRPHDCGNPVPHFELKYSNTACGKHREKESLAVTLQNQRIEVVARVKEAEEKKKERRKEKDEEWKRLKAEGRIKSVLDLSK